MGEPTRGAPMPDNSPECRLDSWKEIAAFLNRDVTTVQRWERREGMPVHRHVHDKRGSVYALPEELQAWLRARQPEPDAEESTPGPSLQAVMERAANYSASRTRFWPALTAIAVLGLFAIAYLVSRGHARGAVPPKIRSLAVLPLKNLSGDASQDYLADGMTEALIGRLAGIHDLRVISHTSVMRFKDSQLSAPEIGKTLSVDALVEGSVMREGNHIRVAAQLIRAPTDDHFWSETYDRELRDVLALQSDVAQSIAQKVEVTVTGKEQERLTAARPVAPEVYESYLQGLFELNTRQSQSGILNSIRYFQEAINRDTTFAPAYLGLAWAYNYLGSNFVGGQPDASLQKEAQAAQKALQLDANLTEAHILLGNVQQETWQWADAESEYKNALDLNPNDAGAHAALAWWLLCQGRIEEGLGWARRARELDPTSLDGSEMGWMLFEARHYDEATQELRSILAVNPDDSVALWDLGIALIDQNRPRDAIPGLEKAASLSKGSPGVIGGLIRAYAEAGRRKIALRLLEELKTRRKKGYVPAGAFVNAYLGLGDKDQAFIWLEQAYKEHSNTLQLLKVDPLFDSIRGDQRFDDLLRRVGLS